MTATVDTLIGATPLGATAQLDLPIYSTSLGSRLRSATRQLGLLCQWQLRRMAEVLPLLITIQTLMSLVTVFGYGLLVGDVPREAAIYLATGAPTITLIMIGVVMVPQTVSGAKAEGSLGWLRTLPVPRWVFMASDVLVWALVAVPGTLVALFLAPWRFGISLVISPWIFLAAPLVALIAAAVGYSIALVAPQVVAVMVSNMLVMLVLMFSPISYPSERLPTWLAEIHRWLPFEPMAQLMRSVLLAGEFQMPLRSGLVLAGWSIVALVAALRALRRRS